MHMSCLHCFFSALVSFLSQVAAVGKEDQSLVGELLIDVDVEVMAYFHDSARVRAGKCCRACRPGVGQYGKPPRTLGSLLTTCTDFGHFGLWELQTVGGPCVAAASRQLSTTWTGG